MKKLFIFLSIFCLCILSFGQEEFDVQQANFLGDLDVADTLTAELANFDTTYAGVLAENIDLNQKDLTDGNAATFDTTTIGVFGANIDANQKNITNLNKLSVDSISAFVADGNIDINQKDFTDVNKIGLDSLISGYVDIGSGEIDGTVIGENSAEDATFDSVKAVNYSGASDFEIGIAGEDVTIDADSIKSDGTTVLFGIDHNDLVDKSAAEAIADKWTFSDTIDVTGTALIDELGEDLDAGGYYILNEQGLINLSANSMPAPYLRFVTDDYVEVADDADLDVGTADFSIQMKIRPDDVSGTKYLANKEDGGVGYGLYMTDDDLYIRLDDNTADASAIIGTACFVAGVEYDIHITFDRDGNATAYVNGVIVGGVDISGSPLTLSNAGALRVGCTTAGASFFGGQISLWRVYNQLNTLAYVQKYQNGSVDFLHQGASQTATYTSDWSADVNGWTVTKGVATGNNDAVSDGVDSKDNCMKFTVDTTSGSHLITSPTDMTVGKRYKLEFSYYIPSAQSNIDGILGGGAWLGGFDETETNSLWNDISCEFTALETSGRLYAKNGNATEFQDAGGDDVFYVHGLTITSIGCVAEYPPDGIDIANSLWHDKQNGLDGTISGCTAHNMLVGMYVNKTTPSANDKLLTVSNDGTEVFAVDKEGDEFLTSSSWTDGTDTFKANVASDKWTLWNDAVTPAAIMTVDSSGNIVATDDVEGDTAFFDVYTNKSAFVLGQSGSDITVSADTIKATTVKALFSAVNIDSLFGGALAEALDANQQNITDINEITMDTITIGSAEIVEAELEILDGATITTTELNLYAAMNNAAIDSLADLSAAELEILDGATVTTTQINRVDATSSIQTQLNASCLESVFGTSLGSGITLDATVLKAAPISQVFLVNAFNCPAPGTDWTPQKEGIKLGANKNTKLFWIPLNFLKIGDVITTYNIVGDILEEGGDTVALLCKLSQINKADPITTTDIANGNINPIVADGDFDVTCNCDDTTVTTDHMYILEISGSTSTVSGNEFIMVIGVEITVTRK